MTVYFYKMYNISLKVVHKGTVLIIIHYNFYVIIGAYAPIVVQNGAWYAKGWPPLCIERWERKGVISEIFTDKNLIQLFQKNFNI